MTVKNITDTPIYILHTDILWRIFKTNTDIYWTERKILVDNATRPLNVLRRTSQVCRKWRDIILSSPTLWSRVLELDLLSQNCEHWRNMVLERCGQSPLCMNGRVSGAHLGPRNFFAGLLDSHWTRIRRFDVYVADHNQFGDETWNNFLRPARKLEVFKLHIRPDDWDPYSIFSHVGRPIFANDAPVLREFTFPDSSRGYLSLQAPWLQQLRSLELAVAFNATELLNSLGNMRALEYLEVGDSILEPEGLPTASVSLPRLHKISISNTLKTSLFLLKHITPSKGSSLFLAVEDTGKIISHQDVADLSDELSRYVRNYFNRTVDFSKSLTLKFGPCKLHFRARDTTDENIPMPPSLDFRVDIFCDDLPETGVLVFLAALDIHQYSRITRLEFIPYRVEILEDAQPILTTLLASLSAVTVLVTPEYGLQALVKAEQTLSDLFPSLQTLWFKFLEPTSDLFPELLLTFLRRRADSGRPITGINISDSTMFKERLDWGYLEEFSGLKVMIQWGSSYADIEEHICGTGVPETLDMRKRL